LLLLALLALLALLLAPFVLPPRGHTVTAAAADDDGSDLQRRGEETLARLRIKTATGDVFVAGLPRFPRVFARDLLVAALLRDNATDLRQALLFCAAHQGTTRDPVTGEEPGKIVHEFPGVSLPASKGTRTTTEFNSIDATPLFLIAAFRYTQLRSDPTTMDALEQPLRAAVEYVLAHVDRRSQLYVEDPSLAGGAKRFALAVTYWKDSAVQGRVGGVPVYPVAYTLAHAQAICALRCASALLPDRSLVRKADRMVDALNEQLWDPLLGSFAVGRDEQGLLTGTSSDALHMLWYLRAGDVSSDRIEAVVNASRPLETVAGYAASTQSRQSYHGFTVWPFEQAFVHAAAIEYGLGEAASVALRADAALSMAPSLGEHFQIRGDRGDGEHAQLSETNEMLWTAAAAIYFASARSGRVLARPAGAWPIVAHSVHGVNPMDLQDYAPGEMFRCLDGQQRIPYSWLNDDYCDWYGQRGRRMKI